MQTLAKPENPLSGGQTHPALICGAFLLQSKIRHGDIVSFAPMSAESGPAGEVAARKKISWYSTAYFVFHMALRGQFGPPRASRFLTTHPSKQTPEPLSVVRKCLFGASKQCRAMVV